jgi:hypothetical protein
MVDQQAYQARTAGQLRGRCRVPPGMKPEWNKADTRRAPLAIQTKNAELMTLFVAILNRFAKGPYRTQRFKA